MVEDTLTLRGLGAIQGVNVRSWGEDGVVFALRVLSVIGTGEHQRKQHLNFNFSGKERKERFEGFFEPPFFDKEDGTRGSSIDVRGMYLYPLAA